MEKHLYEHIDDENDRSKFAESPIPNRHATVHGLVPYASEKSSLNSIFLADFVFLMITQIKKEKITKVAEILKGYALAAESSSRKAVHFGRNHPASACQSTLPKSKLPVGACFYQSAFIVTSVGSAC